MLQQELLVAGDREEADDIGAIVGLWWDVVEPLSVKVDEEEEQGVPKTGSEEGKSAGESPSWCGGGAAVEAVDG